MTFVSRLRAFFADETGAAALLVGLMMPVLVLGLGLGAESGFQYMSQRQMQHAADLAAHAAGTRMRAGDDRAKIVAAALHIATEAGFNPDTDTMAVNTPPLAGSDRGLATSVEVLLSRTQPRFLSAILFPDPALIAARAVSRVVTSGSAACVLALSPTASGAVTIEGSAQVSLVGCDIASNSNANDAFEMIDNGARLSVDCIYTVGEANINTQYLSMSECDEPHELAPVVRDPYEGISEPNANEGVCLNVLSKTLNIFSPNFVHSSGVPALRICGGLDIKRQATFDPGLYIIDGGTFSINGLAAILPLGAGIGGNGVTFLLANGASLAFNGNGSFNLQAPTTGPYAGILFFGGRNQTTVSHEIRGTFGSVTQGAIYTPASSIVFSGNSSTTNGCTQIIARTVQFSGNSTLRSSCTNQILHGALTGGTISIVE